ncbi:MAG: cyclic-di-AMP receptor [Armatimonadetes bacterium]|nr:cyclic-di-AMP receptor [Armatimonadota bacterium]
MKLCVCVVHNRDRNRLSDELIRTGFKFTVIGSSGGFLREGNTTVLIGVEETELDTLMHVIGTNCQTREQIVNIGPYEANPAAAFISSPVKVPVGGAVVFVLPVDRWERF